MVAKFYVRFFTTYTNTAVKRSDPSAARHAGVLRFVSL